jgi:ABC-type phosphate transport system permease subunit
MFQATPFTRRKRRYELLARAVFFLMTLLIVTPLILIVGYLVYQAWP